MNWQNITSDATWASIDNWYWRSWEVGLGIVAACIPALRPGYRSLSASLISHFSHRSLYERHADAALLDTKNAAPKSAGQIHVGPQVPVQAPIVRHGPELRAPPQTMSAKVDRVQKVGADDDTIAMQSLTGDKELVGDGARKMKTFDLSETSVGPSRRDEKPRDLEQGSENRTYWWDE